MTLQVGVVGTGVMGAAHADVLHTSISGARVSAVADLNRQRAAEVAGRAGARVFDDPATLISDPSVDAVLIASHDAAHFDQVKACLEHQKPVLCEKPLAQTPQECQALIEVQAQLGLSQELISVGLMRRFHPPLTALKEALDGGLLGEPLLVLGSHRNVSSYPQGGSEGTLTNSAVHDIDTVSWLLSSRVTEVSWHAPKPTGLDNSRHDPQLIQLRTESGVLASVDLFLNARYGYEVRYEVVCEQGAVQTQQPTLVNVDYDRRAGHHHAADWRGFFADAYRGELQAWVEAVQTGRPSPLASAGDGLHATEVAAALVRSMHKGGVPTNV